MAPCGSDGSHDPALPGAPGPLHRWQSSNRRAGRTTHPTPACSCSVARSLRRARCSAAAIRWRARPSPDYGHSSREELQTIDADKVGVGFVGYPSGVLPCHELLHADRTHAVIGRRGGACVVSDFAAHPDHQMLLIALVEENQVTRPGLVEGAAEKLAVVLNQFDRVDVGADLAAT